MSKQPRNSRCACNSGRKHKNCCGNRPGAAGKVIPFPNSPSESLEMSVAGDRLHSAHVLDALAPLSGLTAALINAVHAEFPAGTTTQWHADVESLVKKSLYHFSSLLSMKDALTLQGPNNHSYPVVDFASAYCLARALFENCLVLRYIFDRQTDDERQFWHSVWRLDGHRERAKHFQAKSREDKDKTLGELHPERLKINQEQIVHWEAQLKGTAKYGSLAAVTSEAKPGRTYDRRPQADSGKWRELHPDGKVTFGQLATEVGLSEHYGHTPYSLASSYTHSLAISCFQILEAHDMSEMSQQYEAALWHGATFHASLLQTYVEKLFPKPGVLAVYEPWRKRIEFWIEMGKA